MSLYRTLNNYNRDVLVYGDDYLKDKKYVVENYQQPSCRFNELQNTYGGSNILVKNKDDTIENYMSSCSSCRSSELQNTYSENDLLVKK